MYKYQKLKSKSGFTIAEVLISLAVTVMLLAAVALALNASVINYNENESVFKAISKAQQALLRICTQLRTASAVDPASPSNELTMVTAEGDDITYRYNSNDGMLYLITNDDLSDDDYVLCSDVTAMSFGRQTLSVDGVTVVRSVCMSLTVDAGTAEKTLSAAAVVRKNLD